MSVITSHSDAMASVVSILKDAKAYSDNPSNEVPDWVGFIESVNTLELEEYLLKKMAANPTFVESAVSEVYHFISAWNRDLKVRKMKFSDCWTDYSSQLDNDIEYYANLKELQAQYIKGRTPQQRS